MGFAEEIISYLGCEYEIIKNAENVEAIMKKYKDLFVLGKSEGFTPLIVVPSSTLMETISFSATENNGHIGDIIESAKSINAVDVLNERFKESTSVEVTDYDIMGDFVEHVPVNKFISLIDYSTNRPYKTVIAAKIPTDKPWELAAWVPMGGWNECPMPAEQVSAFKYWYEKYGAIPSVVHSDIWEMYVERPPISKDDAVLLAWEQFGFCGDIVWQGVEKINILASMLIKAESWYFWWD